MKYAVYLRKSRADDPHEPLEETLRKHREQLTAYMLREGISVLPEDVYEEVVSGDSLYARPQMLRLLEAVEAGEYSGVLCMDIQRLGRGSMRDQGVILDAFKYSGTKILTPTKTYDFCAGASKPLSRRAAISPMRPMAMRKPKSGSCPP